MTPVPPLFVAVCEWEPEGMWVLLTGIECVSEIGYYLCIRGELFVQDSTGVLQDGKVCAPDEWRDSGERAGVPGTLVEGRAADELAKADAITDAPGGCFEQTAFLPL